MKTVVLSVIAAICTSGLALPASGPNWLADAGNQAPSPSDAGFRFPALELQGQLRGTLSFSKCTYMSGLTCKVKYSGDHPLPSRVYFLEFDAEGRQAGPEVRLIYPRLEPGEVGSATFRLRSSSPARVKLRGEWKGAWQDPY